MSNVYQVSNQDHLELWDDFVNKLPARKAALLPLYVDIRDGMIYRNRIPSQDIKTFYKTHKGDIPDYMRTQEEFFPNIDKVFKEYIEHFDGPDGGQAPDDLNPLDIITNRPTYFLFTLPEQFDPEVVWRFSEGVQISCHNDGVGPFRNVLPICTLDDRKSLLVLNRHRSNHPDLKFNLHVTISQTVQKDCKDFEAKTPIIIDPGLGNNGPDIP